MERTFNVSLDWHGVLADDSNNFFPGVVEMVLRLANYIGPENLYLCCYCGRRTERTVRRILAGSPLAAVFGDRLLFTRERTGACGKAARLVEEEILVHVDDHPAIVDECRQSGICAIKVNDPYHRPRQDGFPSTSAALNFILTVMTPCRRKSDM